jgi:hypothetical protein
MAQLVKTKRQANFKGFKRIGAFKGLVEQKNVVFNSFVCKLGHSCQKRPNLHTNSLNKLLLTWVHSSEKCLYPSTVKTSILFKNLILTVQEFFEFIRFLVPRKRALFGDIVHLKSLSPRIFLLQMTF